MAMAELPAVRGAGRRMVLEACAALIARGERVTIDALARESGKTRSAVESLVYAMRLVGQMPCPVLPPDRSRSRAPKVSAVMRAAGAIEARGGQIDYHALAAEMGVSWQVAHGRVRRARRHAAWRWEVILHDWTPERRAEHTRRARAAAARERSAGAKARRDEAAGTASDASEAEAVEMAEFYALLERGRPEARSAGMAGMLDGTGDRDETPPGVVAMPARPASPPAGPPPPIAEWVAQDRVRRGRWRALSGKRAEDFASDKAYGFAGEADAGRRWAEGGFR